MSFDRVEGKAQVFGDELHVGRSGAHSGPQAGLQLVKRPAGACGGLWAASRQGIVAALIAIHGAVAFRVPLFPCRTHYALRVCTGVHR